MKLLPAVALAMLLLVPAQAAAVGIGPARMEMDFEPNLDRDFSVQVRNGDNISAGFRMYASGDLANYVTFRETNFTLAAGEVKTVTFNLKLPASLEPGRRDSGIGVVQEASGGAALAAQVGVEMQFWMYVPYPDSYISVSISHSKPQLGSQMGFDVTFGNPARNNLTASMEMEIRDSNGTVHERFDFGSSYIAVGDSKTVHATWVPKGPGDYGAVARAYYDQDITAKESRFSVPKGPGQAPTGGIILPSINLVPYMAVIVLLVIAIAMVLVWPKEARK